MKKTFTISLLSLSLFLALGVTIVEAQNPTGPGTTNPTGPGTTNPTGPGTTNPTGPLGVQFEITNLFRVGDNLYDLVENIVNKIILPIGGVLCVLAFIYAGFIYVTAGGDTAKIKTAHNALLYASVGTAVLLGAWVIASAIRNTINQVIS